MVHSPMVGVRRHPLGTGSQGRSHFWWAVSRSTRVINVSFSPESSSLLVRLGEVGSSFRWDVQCKRGVEKNPEEVQLRVIVIYFFFFSGSPEALAGALTCT